MKNRSGLLRALACLAAVFILLTLIVSAFAEGGDGSGGGKDIPFQFVSSSISNGAENVDPGTSIVLGFNKNVVNIAVRENNMKCFTLKDEDGKQVPIEIIMGDDQVEPTHEVKRTVTVKPKSSLEYSTEYILKISKDLQAKNGSYLEKDSYISFTTAEKPTSKPVAVRTTAARERTTKETTTKREISTSRVARYTSTAAQTQTAETVSKTTAQTKTTAAITTTAKQDIKTTVKSEKTASVTSVTVTVTEETSADAQVDVTAETEIKEPSAVTVQTEDFSEEVTASEETADTESSGKSAYLPYIISGAIAIVAVPAIVIFIKKKK
ncbi:MAG: Ig-like domain-containing protein [Clostridia bacterium]|nr:Ig-like domain-containing protein [Clostridia bacterium]